MMKPMNKFQKTTLIISILIFGGIWFALPVLAIEPPPLVVEFENDPLFNEANFLPGQSVTRWVKVTNNSGENQKIGVKAINVNDPDNFGSTLQIVISENGTDLYGGTTGTKYLSDFFGDGEIYLSDLASGNTTTYYFSVTFVPQSGNDYQNLSLSFDFQIGFFGKETIGEEIPSEPTEGEEGGGGGGVTIYGLHIFNEKSQTPSSDTVTVTWFTNIPATSRVIYDTISHPVLGNPPNYGYAFSTDEDPTKVTFHSMTIEGLIPGTTYYWRAVSHTSPKEVLGDELTFTTKEIAIEIPSAPQIPPVPTPTPPSSPPVPPEGEILPPTEKEFVQPEEAPLAIEETKPPAKTLFGRLLAAVGGLFTFKNPCSVFAFSALALIVLFALLKKENKRLNFILMILILLAIIFYRYFCGLNWLVSVLLLILLIILYYLIKKKKS